MDNHLDCYQGAFTDGFEKGIPFDSYRVIKNCNCIITSNVPINITNKHQAIIYYKNNEPVRLLVANKDTDIDKCIDMALEQSFNGHKLKTLFEAIGIKRIDLDYHQLPISNKCDHSKEIEVGSCDREALLKSMLTGSYTESDSDLGKDNTNLDFRFVPNIYINYDLITGDEHFIINHSNAFVNSDLSRIIPLQDNSLLDIDEIKNEYMDENNRTL